MNQNQFPSTVGSPALLENLSIRSVAEAVVALAVAWLLITWIHRVVESLSKRSIRGRLFVKQIEPFVTILVWLLAAQFALRFLAPSRETFLALVASIGLAVCLGAQDLVRNVIGGLVVLADRPFQVGDRVRIGDAYGEISHIAMRCTRLITPDDTSVVIPNSFVLSAMVFNANAGVPDCQVVTDVVVPYGVDPQGACRIGYEAAYSSPFLLLDKPVVVLLLDRFDRQPYCLLRIKAYVYDHRAEPRMQSDITIRVKQTLMAAGLIPPQWDAMAVAPGA